MYVSMEILIGLDVGWPLFRGNCQKNKVEWSSYMLE